MFVNAEIFLEMLMLLGCNGNPIIRSIIRDFMEIYEKESKNDLHMGENEHIKFYATIIKELLETELNEQDFRIMLAKMKTMPFIQHHRDIYDSVETMLFPKEPLTDQQKNMLIKHVQNYLLWYYAQDYTRKMFGKLSAVNYTAKDDKKEKLLEEVNNISGQISDKFHMIRSARVVPTNIINFSDKESIARGVKKHKLAKVAGVFKTGWHGLNRMFGERGGPARGESIVFAALSHNCKSLMLMNMAKWIINYNTPIAEAGKGKPTILFISLENEASDNLMSMYRSIYESLTQNSGLNRPDEEVVEFIYEYFNRRGWTLIMERRVGDDFGYEDYKGMYEAYTKLGHCIISVIVDYVNKMKKSFSGKDGNYLALQTLFDNMINFTTEKGSTFFTAHQLNSDAARLASSGITNVVRKFNFEHLEDGKAPFKVPDVVIFCHIESNTYGIKYLTMSIKKHRHVTTTPERHKNTAYRFTPFGITDDIEGEDQSVKDIYADAYDLPPGTDLGPAAVTIEDGFF